MPYAPTVNDNSGQILAGYQTRSAEIKAAGNEALAQGIMDGATSAIGGIAGAYQQSRMQAAGGKAFKDFMKVTGPSMGISNEQLKMFTTMNDQDAYNMSSMFMNVGPALVSANTWAPRAAMQSQNAIYQNQVPANQQPINAGAVSNPQGATSNWRDLVPSRQQP